MAKYYKRCPVCDNLVSHTILFEFEDGSTDHICTECYDMFTQVSTDKYVGCKKFEASEFEEAVDTILEIIGG